MATLSSALTSKMELRRRDALYTTALNKASQIHAWQGCGANYKNRPGLDADISIRPQPQHPHTLVAEPIPEIPAHAHHLSTT